MTTSLELKPEAEDIDKCETDFVVFANGQSLCVVKTVSEAARHVRGNENSASSKAELELLDGLWSSGREFGKV